MPFQILPDQTKIHYIQSGNGSETIIFVHGNLANTIWWEKTLQKLPSKYTGYALDLPGSGQSPETGKRHTIEYFADLVFEFSRSLGVQNFHLVGHSMGGGVSQMLTLKHPDSVRKLVLLDSMAADGFHVLYEYGESRMQFMKKNKDFLDKAVRAIAPRCLDEELMKRVVDAAFCASEQVFTEQPVTMHEANWMHRLSEIKCPVLFLHGGEDDFVPKDGSERTAKAIPGCIFKYLPNCGHSPLLEVFDLYFEEVFGFLE
ncbi:MAG TPA: hypothetical protein DHW82_07210 [Spirochaetia bacterium]|nr:hypothetical protein [Spirochaetia bacterium]